MAVVTAGEHPGDEGTETVHAASQVHPEHTVPALERELPDGDGSGPAHPSVDAQDVDGAERIERPHSEGFNGGGIAHVNDVRVDFLSSDVGREPLQCVPGHVGGDNAHALVGGSAPEPCRCRWRPR